MSLKTMKEQLERCVERRRNEMNPNIYMYEQLKRYHCQTLLVEVELEQRLADMQPTTPPHWLHSLATRLGRYW
jgi:hypothetical protein